MPKNVRPRGPLNRTLHRRRTRRAVVPGAAGVTPPAAGERQRGRTTPFDESARLSSLKTQHLDRADQQPKITRLKARRNRAAALLRGKREPAYRWLEGVHEKAAESLAQFNRRLDAIPEFTVRVRTQVGGWAISCGLFVADAALSTLALLAFAKPHTPEVWLSYAAGIGVAAVELICGKVSGRNLTWLSQRKVDVDEEGRAVSSASGGRATERRALVTDQYTTSSRVITAVLATAFGGALAVVMGKIRATALAALVGGGVSVSGGVVSLHTNSSSTVPSLAFAMMTAAPFVGQILISWFSNPPVSQTLRALRRDDARAGRRLHRAGGRTERLRGRIFTLNRKLAALGVIYDRRADSIEIDWRIESAGLAAANPDIYGVVSDDAPPEDIPRPDAPEEEVGTEDYPAGDAPPFIAPVTVAMNGNGSHGSRGSGDGSN